MTREEAIVRLGMVRGGFCADTESAINMAIEALQEHSTPTIPTFAESEQAYKAWTGEDMDKSEPSDLISRADAIKMLDGNLCVQGEVNANNVRNYILGTIEKIKSLPSADRPSGEWLEIDMDLTGYYFQGYYCSECHHVYRIKCNYCPSCGARMKGGAE